MTIRGQFIAFEGGEGTGKSTQVECLARRLEDLGIDVIATREPGGTPMAEALRTDLLAGRFSGYGPDFEAMVVYLARFDHLKARIRPALSEGRWVITDRFSDSTRVYQGMALGADERLIDGLECGLVGADAPDLTFVLDLSVDEAMRRVRNRPRACLSKVEPFYKGKQAKKQKDNAFLMCDENQKGSRAFSFLMDKLKGSKSLFRKSFFSLNRFDLTKKRSSSPDAKGDTQTDETIVTGDRFDDESREFYEKVRSGFLARAESAGASHIVIDASKPSEIVAQDIWAVVSKYVISEPV